ncbi:necrosis inducing protein [Xylariales sp. AK1849]|nr:necrosis inducing protein [Xylariales sp. AK1849]
MPMVMATPLIRPVEPPPSPLPSRATADDLKWQPALDYGIDGCYNVAAIGPNGRLSQGLAITGNESPGADCHDENDLDNQNVYSRQRCNLNWCVYMYDYYFEKYQAYHRSSQVIPKTGNTSPCGFRTTRQTKEVNWLEGTHQQVVYHKDGLLTHAFRFAEGCDLGRIQNDKGVYWRGKLVSYLGFPSGELRDKMMGHDWGQAHIAINDAAFKSHIVKSLPDGSDFDAGKDVGSPGTPPE